MCSSSKGKGKVKGKHGKKGRRWLSKDIVYDEVQVLLMIGLMWHEAIIVDVPKRIINLFEVDDAFFCEVTELALPSFIVNHELRVVMAEKGLEDINDRGIVRHPFGLEGRHHEHLNEVLSHNLFKVKISIDDVPLGDLKLIEH